MNPDYSLADWVSNRGILTQILLSSYGRHAFRVLGQKNCWSTSITFVQCTLVQLALMTSRWKCQ
jgi:hypothetical protein